MQHMLKMPRECRFSSQSILKQVVEKPKSVAVITFMSKNALVLKADFGVVLLGLGWF